MKRSFITALLMFPAIHLFAQNMLKQETMGSPVTPAVRLEVTYIANSGFMFASESTRILVDALYLNGDIWETPSKKIQKAMTKGSAPFRNISHLLVSHYHDDHFDATLVSRFLINNLNATLVTNRQTDSVLRRVYRQDPELRRPGQLKIIQAPMFGYETYETDQFSAKCLVQRHMGKDDYKVESMGLLIEMAGKKILHIGDADYTDENFAGYNLQDEKIDVAFIHYWFLLDCEGRRIIETYIKPK